MALPLEPLSLPFEEDEYGVLRVSDSRVPIDFLIYDYRNGATVEEIALNYPSLKLADIHMILSYYLRHQANVDRYLEAQEALSEQKRSTVLQRSPQPNLRERLRNRLK